MTGDNAIESVPPVKAFHSALLPATLRNALCAPFYRELWEGYDTHDASLMNLCSLPPVGKEAIRRAGRKAQVRDGVVCDETFTSGTTGPPLITVRSHREQAYIYDFFAQMGDDSTRRMRRGVQIRNPYHGHQVRIPTRTLFHEIGIFDAGSFEHARKILSEGGDDPGVDDRCSLVVGLERCLRAFASYLMEADDDLGAEMGVDVVVSYSQYLTRAWREKMESVFAAPVIDRYSLAEIFGGASSCVACGWWHFDPFVIPQVIGTRSSRPVHEGFGLLLLTALFPFQQAQPMVRYSTGDLVEVTRTRSCRPGEIAIKPLGRANYGVPASSGDGWLVHPVDVLEVLDARTDLARMPRFVDSPQVRDPFAIGHPRYKVNSRCRAGATEVDLSVQPKRRLRGAVRRKFVDAITQSLLEEAPGLARAVDEGSARLRVSISESIQGDLVAHSE